MGIFIVIFHFYCPRNTEKRRNRIQVIGPSLPLPRPLAPIKCFYFLQARARKRNKCSTNGQIRCVFRSVRLSTSFQNIHWLMIRLPINLLLLLSVFVALWCKIRLAVSGRVCVINKIVIIGSDTALDNLTIINNVGAYSTPTRSSHSQKSHSIKCQVNRRPITDSIKQIPWHRIDSWQWRLHRKSFG